MLHTASAERELEWMDAYLRASNELLALRMRLATLRARIERDADVDVRAEVERICREHG